MAIPLSGEAGNVIFEKNVKEAVDQGISTVLPSNPTKQNEQLDEFSKAINFIQKQQTDLFPSSILLRGLTFDRIKITDWNKVYPYRFLLLRKKGNHYTPDAIIVLPITPQNITISSQFASQISVGGRGILEEHSGLNVKVINFTATTGVLPSREAFKIEDKQDTDFNAIFGGTIQAIQEVPGLLRAIEASATGDRKIEQTNHSDNVLKYSGYYQYHLIRAFLELYAEMKKSPNNRDLRLGLELGKDRVIYLVTPQSFIANKSASSPLEITYTFTGIAWGTVSGTEFLAKEKELLSFSKKPLSDLRKALNTFRNFRRIIEKFKDIVLAVQTDIQTNIFGPINNIIIITKEFVSLAKTIDDFDENIRKFWEDRVINEGKNFENLLPNELKEKMRAITASSLETTEKISLKSKILNDPDIISNIPIDSLGLTPEEQEAVDAAVEKALNTNKSDVVNLISKLEDLSNSLEKQAEAQGIDSPVWDILNLLYESVSELYSLLANNFFSEVTVEGQETGVNPLLDFYQDYTANGGVNFTKFPSKFAVPLPFKTSLEWLAQRYLGDPTRWMEIAAVNNLQPPYIDEDGFLRSFITNGQGRQFNINSSDNLFVGQTIWLFSDTVPVERRKIKSIQKITDDNFIITVDGDDNLDKFLVANNAKMRAYLPNTVNSQKLIFIPIEAPSNIDNTQITSIAFIDETPEMLQLAKVDLLLDQNGDLAVSQDGFQNLAYGKNNIIQAARLKLQTALGQLLFHPEYGAKIEAGESNADFSLNNIVNAIKLSFESDTRFEAIDSIEVNRNNDTLKIRIVAIAADNQGIVPIDFDVNIK